MVPLIPTYFRILKMKCAPTSECEQHMIGHSGLQALVPVPTQSYAISSQHDDSTTWTYGIAMTWLRGVLNWGTRSQSAGRLGFHCRLEGMPTYPVLRTYWRSCESPALSSGSHPATRQPTVRAWQEEDSTG